MTRIKQRIAYEANGLWYFPWKISGYAVLAEVMERRDNFAEWLDEKKRTFKDLPVTPESERYNSVQDYPDWMVRNYQPFRRGEQGTLYVINLDEKILYVDEEPMFCLDELPSRETFKDCLILDHYGFRAPAARVPWRSNALRYLTQPPPSVPDSVVSSFLRLREGTNSIPIHDLISRVKVTSFCESVCANMLALFVGWLMRQDLYRPTFRNSHFVAESKAFTPEARWFMYLFVRLATCPVYYHCTAWRKDGAMPSERFFQEDGPLSWWPREHICVRMSTHLEDERNCQFAITQLASEIMEHGSSQIVYGIAFSLVHCVFIRVDRENGGSFQYTSAMQFLPSRFSNSALTPGMTALVRVGGLPGYDDTLFYRRAIPLVQRRKSKAKTTINRRKGRSSSNTPLLPLDVLNRVARYIVSPDDLNAFACLCKTAMAASVPWLKYPQVEALQKNEKKPGHRKWASIIVHDCAPLPVEESKHTHLWSGNYKTVIRQKEVEVHSAGYNMVYDSLDDVASTFSLVIDK